MNRKNIALTAAKRPLFNAFFFCIALFFCQAIQAATPPNTPVVNVVTATYKVDGKSLGLSATSAINTAARTPSTVSLLGAVPAQHQGAQATSVNPGACLLNANGTSTWQTQSTLQSLFAGNLSAPTTVSTVLSKTFSGRDVLMVAVSDPDQNRDPLRIERVSVEVTSSTDRETLQLAETGSSTGYFVGWVQLTRQAGVAGDCRLSVAVNDTLRARYTDAQDVDDIVTGTALVDPYGVVFNSLTGAPVNGAVVSIFDDSTGLPATVYGDDGVSSYPSVYQTGRDVTDGSGVLYSLGAGHYRFPLVVPGIYRFQVVPPEGYSFPSALNEGLISKAFDDSFAVGVGAKGEVFPVPLGPAVRIDIPIDPRVGKLLLTKTSDRLQASVGDLIRYEITLRNSDPSLVPELVITDQLPVGLRLRAGSIKDYEGKQLKVLQDTSGRSFRVEVGALSGASQYRFNYLVEVTAAARIGTAINQAIAVGVGSRSEVASATIQIVDDLMLSRSIVIGTVFEGGCPKDTLDSTLDSNRGLSGARIVLQDGRYANTDVNGKWHIEGVQPGTTMVRLDRLSLPTGQVVLPCVADPRRSAGNAAHTINVQPGSLNRIDFYTQSTSKIQVDGSRSASVQNSTSSVTPAVVSTNDQIAAAEQAVWLRKSTGLEWAFPRDGFAPPEGYQSFLIAHKVGQRVVLEHQGVPVAGFHYEGAKTGPDGQMATSLWRNVHLRNGENRFVARVVDGNNQVIAQIEKVLHLATAPARAELVVERSRLVANGRDPAVIAIRLFDAKDKPVRKDITGEFSINSPYAVKAVADAVAKNALAPIITPGSRYEVGQDGIAYIALAPTTQSGEVEITFSFNAGRTQTVRAWLQADQREWIVVGFAEGSPVGAKLREKMQVASGLATAPTEIQGERLALYAKGTIPGDLLLTLAYDSAKSRTDVGNEPQAIAVAPFYTIYSDESQSGMEAQSRGKLFVKIEKATFVALLGNSQTGLTISELGRYAQSMYGLKSSWQGERFSYTAFVMRNLTSFHRDVIRADGTTGSWQLSRQMVIPNTDQVRVVSRSRFDVGNVLSERVLARATDYSVDYLSGRIQLAQPVLPFDVTLNPVTIEVEYSTENPTGSGVTMGGRVAFKATDKIELGLTLIENKDSAKGGQLSAIDINTKLAESTTLKIEAGQSSRLESNAKASGTAQLIELRHDRSDLNARLYYRRTDAQYGLNDQPVGSADLQSYGGEIRTKLTEKIQLEAQLSAQERISTGQTADLVQAKLLYVDQPWQVSGGARVGRETNGQGVSSSITQVLGNVGYLSPDQRWSLRFGAELGPERTGSQFPNRLSLEGDYRFTSSLAATASQSWVLANARTTETSLGLRFNPWVGSEVQVGLTQRNWAEGDNSTARASLVQTTKLNSFWTLNAQLSGSRQMAGSVFAPLTSNALTANSTVANVDDFTTAGFTLSYNSEPWSGYLRSEKRWADDGRYSIASGVSHKLNAGEHLLATLKVERFSNDAKPSTQVTIAHAVRRQNSPWSFLTRLDLIDSYQGSAGTNGNVVTASSGSNATQIVALAPTVVGPSANLTGRRLLLSSHWNYLSPSGFEWLSRVAVKRVLESSEGDSYGTSFAVIGTELRKPFNKTLDLGIHAVHARSFSSNVTNTGFGASVGLRLIENTVVTFGYNFRGIKDSDFYSGNQRAAGAFIWFRFFLDENLLGLSRSAAAAMAESR